jgi:hypothetical protein
MDDLTTKWSTRGIALNFAAGLDMGYATLGSMGFTGRQECGAVGVVVQVAGALSEHAAKGL